MAVVRRDHFRSTYVRGGPSLKVTHWYGTCACPERAVLPACYPSVLLGVSRIGAACPAASQRTALVPEPSFPAAQPLSKDRVIWCCPDMEASSCAGTTYSPCNL